MRNQAEMGVRGILSCAPGPVKLTAAGYIPAMGERPSLAPTEGLLAVVRGLRAAGHEAWAVGGAVRDRLLGESPGDWDVATDALPERVREIFPRTHPVGIEHGTVAVLEAGETIEVTTFRADVATDGRHARVRFGVSLE
jgi:tRNA nucleotidyltransferase/poly(A) polymerase